MPTTNLPISPRAKQPALATTAPARQPAIVGTLPLNVHIIPMVVFDTPRPIKRTGRKAKR